MIKPETFAELRLRCPACSKGTYAYQHIAAASSVGPWYCEACGAGWKITRLLDGSPVVERHGKHTPSLVTLKIPPQSSPITIKLKGSRWEQPGDPVALGEGDEYFYNEHSCPTNWLPYILELEFEGNEDPHGLIRYVKTEPWPDDEDALK